MKFTKAERTQAKLRLALTGPSGSGKTYGALLIAKGLGGKVAVIDTEHKSASLYAGMQSMPEFDTLHLPPPYTPERFIEAIQSAEKAGYDTLIIDSITHEWSGSGGCLELNEQLANSRFRGNTWSAWNVTTPRHRQFLDTILHSSLHVIGTMRSKTETVQGEDKKVKKLGMKSEQRDGTDYEFTTVLDIVHDGHYAVASKDRTGLFTDTDPAKITEDTGKQLLAWLNFGAVPLPDEPPPPPPTITDAPEFVGLSEDQQIDITAAAREADMTIEQICTAGKVANLKDIPAAKYAALLKWVRASKKPVGEA
jgi:hypothetical protein